MTSDFDTLRDFKIPKPLIADKKFQMNIKKRAETVLQKINQLEIYFEEAIKYTESYFISNYSKIQTMSEVRKMVEEGDYLLAWDSIFKAVEGVVVSSLPFVWCNLACIARILSDPYIR